MRGFVCWSWRKPAISAYAKKIAARGRGPVPQLCEAYGSRQPTMLNMGVMVSVTWLRKV